MEANFLKNPIIWGIICAALTYLYLWWESKKTKKAVNLFYVGLVGVIAWFVTSYYFDSEVIADITEVPRELPVIERVDNNVSELELGKNNIPKIGGNNSVGSTSFHLTGKNRIRLPPPDVFIDMANF